MLLSSCFPEYPGRTPGTERVYELAGQWRRQLERFCILILLPLLSTCFLSSFPSFLPLKVRCVCIEAGKKGPRKQWDRRHYRHPPDVVEGMESSLTSEVSSFIQGTLPVHCDVRSYHSLSPTRLWLVGVKGDVNTTQGMKLIYILWFRMFSKIR